MQHQSLIEGFLLQQRTLTAVEELSAFHERTAHEPKRTRHFRDLIPAQLPSTGQQYAFDVDLDACSGCKGCVTACHSMNGLEPGETWRSVGLLHGGNAESPIQQTITTACHHCVEPACMKGCPVGAYDKNPITGIVKHLDDQCIGCQYCVFMCPYEVPQYSKQKGIVRKCDMCSERLSAGEAPACVQACPTEAIRITIVEEEDVIEASEATAFLPGTPEPSITLPTTQYRARRAFPSNLLPADYYAVRPGRAHPALVAMLVLTQLSVGAFAVLALLGRERPAIPLALGLAALAASVFHLGRPQYAWRAIIGLRTSWLSREILAFGAFATLAVLYAFTSDERVGVGVVAAGSAGVFCSVMVYAATERECWRASVTGAKFLLTSAVLGVATCLVVYPDAATTLCAPLVASAFVKLGWEVTLLLRIRDRRHTALKRTAMLQLGELGRHTVTRFACGLVGGIALPLLYLAIEGGPDVGPLFLMVLSGVATALVLVGELVERHLFFIAASAPRMPGELP